MSLDAAAGPLAAWDLGRLGAGLGLPALSDPVWRELAASADGLAVLAAASAEAGSPWPQPRTSDFARYVTDGNRSDYEADVFASAARLSRAALAAALDPSPARFAEVADGVGSLCERATWCWPAHDDAHARLGHLVPDVDAPFLDLGAGEAAALLAWTDALLGARLDEHYPGLRARLRREVRRRVLAPFLERTDWHWLGLTTTPHNWLAWICQNVLTAALALEVDGELRERVLRRAVSGLDRYLASLPADGAIDEGVSYWWAGACRALEALDVLHEASGGTLDASALPAVRELVAFPHRMQLAPAWWASFSDASPRLQPGRDGQPWHVLARWAERVGDDDAVDFTRAARLTTRLISGERVLDLAAPLPGAGLGRMLGALLESRRSVVGGDGNPRWPLPERVWLPSTQVLVLRERAGTGDGLSLLVKGGHNGEAHNHLDVGSVSLTLDGAPAVVDLGRATYTATTFSADRYSEWHIASAWHAVPAPGGAGQLLGPAAAAVVTAIDDDGVTLALDALYPGAAAASRAARLQRGPSPRVVVVDTWELDADGSPAPTDLVWVLAGEVRSEGPDAVVVAPPGGGVLRISWTSPQPTSSRLEGRELTDPYLREAWGERITRLVVTSAAPAGSVQTTFARA